MTSTPDISLPTVWDPVMEQLETCNPSRIRHIHLYWRSDKDSRRPYHMRTRTAVCKMVIGM